MNRSSLAVLALLVASPLPAFAQSQQAKAQPGCGQPATEPATPAAKGGQASGTAPGNSGSTGWSGSGLGGAYSGTTQAGPVGSSPSWHPVTAKGLDPIKGMATSQKPAC